MSARKVREPASERRVKAAEPLAPATVKIDDAQEWASWLGDDGARIADLLVAIEGLTDEANAYARMWHEATGQPVTRDQRFGCAEQYRNDALEALTTLRENSVVIRDGLYEAVNAARRAPGVREEAGQ